MYDAFKLLQRAEDTIKAVKDIHFPGRYRQCCSPDEVRAYARSTGVRVRYREEFRYTESDVAEAEVLLSRVGTKLRIECQADDRVRKDEAAHRTFRTCANTRGMSFTIYK
jgi:hypothetical protein